MTSQIEDVAERYFAAWAAHDAAAIAALHAPDTQFWLHTGGDPIVGRTAVRDAFAELFVQFPDFTWQTHRVLYGADHWILDWALISGEVRLDCLDVVTVRPTGLVARKDTFVDAAHLAAVGGTA
jgi:ketosteroid isomerase-like protein